MAINWEQVELNDIAPVTMGQSPNSKNYTENPNNYILVQGNADLFNGQVLPRIYTTQITKVAHVGDILMSVRAPVGNIAQTQYDVVIGRGVAAISGNLFIKQLLYKMDKAGYWNKYIAGSTFESVNSSDIKSANIKVPKLKEQEKIGQLFQSLDKTITLHEKKQRQLERLKKALLQKMFADETGYPALRFEGFTEKWEQRKLGDVTDIKTGSRNHQDSVENGKYPFFVRSEKIERLNEYDFDTTAILIPGDGRIGEIFHYYDGKFALHQRVYKVDNFNGIDALFLLSLFRYSFRRHALRLNAQGTVPSLRLPMFTKWEILLPKLEEQEKIGQLFQSLDKTITLHDKKIQYLKQLKRGLLQKMFV